MSPIETGLQDTYQRIGTVARACGRDPATVRLVAVSKTFAADAVRSAYLSGQRAFGENYVQEALAKIEALAGLPGIEWHMIGPLQSNKTRAVAERFAWVHTVDRLRLAQRLGAARPPALGPLDVCIQVNVSGEATKSGVSPAEAIGLAHAVAAIPGIRLRGFMGIAEPSIDPAVPRAQFAVLRQLLGRAQQEGIALDTLSMGMSVDLESAIAEGATLVRVGTAIFGARVRT